MINTEKIYFSLDRKISERLHARYKNRAESIGLSIVPKVIEHGELMSYEEQIKAAMDYLKNILT